MKMPEWFETEEQINENPPGWEGGRVRHTGGGFWCREWRRELPDGRSFEVVYNNHKNGIALERQPYEDDCGVDETVIVAEPDEHTDEAFAEAAKRAMKAFNVGHPVEEEEEESSEWHANLFINAGAVYSDADTSEDAERAFNSLSGESLSDEIHGIGVEVEIDGWSDFWEV